jgi:hypothetical protein
MVLNEECAFRSLLTHIFILYNYTTFDTKFGLPEIRSYLPFLSAAVGALIADFFVDSCFFFIEQTLALLTPFVTFAFEAKAGTTVATSIAPVRMNDVALVFII